MFGHRFLQLLTQLGAQILLNNAKQERRGKVTIHISGFAIKLMRGEAKGKKERKGKREEQSRAEQIAFHTDIARRRRYGPFLRGQTRVRHRGWRWRSHITHNKRTGTHAHGHANVSQRCRL